MNNKPEINKYSVLQDLTLYLGINKNRRTDRHRTTLCKNSEEYHTKYFLEKATLDEKDEENLRNISKSHIITGCLTILLQVIFYITTTVVFYISQQLSSIYHSSCLSYTTAVVFHIPQQLSSI